MADSERGQVITAMFKLNLHCNECARTVKKPIIRSQGVEKVDVDVQSGKVTVWGIFDPMKVYEMIEKKSKRKVEWLSPKPVQKEEMIEPIQKKEEVVRATVIKLHLHCDKCKNDVEKLLLKFAGVHSVKMDREKQTCTIVGIVEEEKLLKYIHKKAGKRGRVIEQIVERIESNEIRGDEWLWSNDELVPCFLHCTHAPQWFSDENPNACSVM